MTQVKTHAAYILVITALLLLGRVWLSEHDARVRAEQTVKESQVLVADLKAQIVTTQQQAAAKVQVVTKTVQQAKTPSQVVAAAPSLADLPLSVREVPGNTLDVLVAAQPLAQELGELKIAQVELKACQDVSGLKDKQLAAKDTEIVALKKKPRFLVRVKHVAEAVGIGIGVGLFISTKI